MEQRPRPKELMISVKNASPIVSKSRDVYSPVTELSLNLGGLTTAGFGDTPKRRLSICSNASSTPGSVGSFKLKPLRLERQISADAGCVMDSPSPIDSPSLQERSTFKSDALKRFQSMPLPFCSLESSPKSTHIRLSDRQLPEIHIEGSPEKASFFIPSDEQDDDNSQDSGVCVDRHAIDFRFAEPIAPAPRRHTPSKKRILSDQTNSPTLRLSVRFRSNSTPVENSLLSPGFEFLKNTSPVKLRRSSLTNSSENDDGDDGFLDIMDMDDDKNKDLPQGFSSLITGTLHSKDDLVFTPGMAPDCRFNLFGQDNQENETPKMKNIRKGLFRSPSVPSFDQVLRSPSQISNKRSEPDCERTPLQALKRRKSVVAKDSPKVHHKIQRCQSMNEDMIKMALNRVDDQPDLIGDLSKTHCLPLIRGKHQDLRSISPETLAKVINNEFSAVVENATIVDCRYPYEYNGGHIQGAKNIYTKDGIQEEFMKNVYKHTMTPSTGKRNILVFHCEFSSERGPKMSRFLRELDRKANKESYPRLNYPEIYLLDNGYKAFYYTETCRQFCEPMTYLPMLHADHASDLKHFRIKSKSWAGGEKQQRGRVPFRKSFNLL